jgi:dipeptidyl aminopeptidase/acylaminoacyl peptidase
VSLALAVAAALLPISSACRGSHRPAPLPAAEVSPTGYRVPDEAVVRLLTAAPPPDPLVHAGTGRVALLFRGLLEFEWVARPRLGLAGFRFDPQSLTSGMEPLVTYVEIIEAGAPEDASPQVWRPPADTRLDHVRFSPDGRMLSALAVRRKGPARLALFDLASGVERTLDVPVNPAWGDPCEWVASGFLVCRVVPSDWPPPPPGRAAPETVEHTSGPAPTRTWSNLLESANDEALFEHFFTAGLARVDPDGRMTRLPVDPGLLSSLSPSPDGTLAVVTRIEGPFSSLVRAREFPSRVELWELAEGRRLYASNVAGYGVEAEEQDREEPRRAAWRPGASRSLGWIERETENGDFRADLWMSLEASVGSTPRELVRSTAPILRFGWSTAGTPWFATRGAGRNEARVWVVSDGVPRELWSGATGNRYGSPGRALRADGDDGPVLEHEGRIFLASDGQGPDGPQPYLDALVLRTGRSERVFQADPGVFEEVLAVLDPVGPVLLTSRETESDPPRLYRLRGPERRALGSARNPYPELDGVRREVVRYNRADGVALSGSLYLPAGWDGEAPLPTLVWIYPYEFTDREQAEQIDVRAFQFHKVKGPSPLAALLEGYAVLLNPTVPILYEGSLVNDDYVPQLVSSIDAALDHLEAIGVAEPGRIAVAGRSYGAFSSANLLVHSRRFATAIAMSGAYNRTLTPFGFQREKRSFWQATALYTAISPFFHVDRIEVPVLLVHGGADENPGTPPLQARRFLHALVGEGVPVRYVELPYEGHHYWARESVLHAAAEMLDWLDRTIGPGRATVAPE